mmetsp:Transcript_2162/g.3213  ORF Transcript_2162/g.3213 Transcript_2162/m.3213 type:complete len:280 (-) Transcript_2162:445-1284(-)
MPEELPVTSQEETDTGSSRCFRIFEIIFIVGLLAIALVVEFSTLPQNKRDIPFQLISNATFIRDLSYNWPIQEDESVSTLLLILLGIALPFVCQLLLAVFVLKPKRPFEIYNTSCSFVLVISMTLLIIDMIKLYTGVLRPHFYDACQPDASYEACTNTADEYDSRLSFPSGHAGNSMAGLGSLSLYIHRRFGVGSVQSHAISIKDEQLARVWSMVSVLPVLLALYCGTSRIYDNYHQPADVVGGAAIGAASAYFCHWIYFWNLSSSKLTRGAQSETFEA